MINLEKIAGFRKGFIIPITLSSIFTFAGCGNNEGDSYLILKDNNNAMISNKNKISSLIGNGNGYYTNRIERKVSEKPKAFVQILNDGAIFYHDGEGAYVFQKNDSNCYRLNNK